MKFSFPTRFGIAITLALAVGTPAWADAKSDLTAAAKKLGEAKNYTWTTTVDLEGMPFKPGPTHGKRQKDGYVWVSSEMMGNTSEAFLRGTNGVAKVDGEWKSEADLPQFGGPGGPDGGRPPGGGDRPNTGGPGGPGGRGGFAGMGARRLLQTKAPHEAALMYAEKGKDLKSTDGAISGELPEDVVKELAMFGRRGRGGGPGGGGPGNAKGWIKIKIANGQITKTIVEIESEMRAPDGGTQTINAITTTEIQEVGTTQLDIPEGVKAKLEKADK